MQRMTALPLAVMVSMHMQSLHHFLDVRQDLQSPSCLESPRVYSTRPMGLPHFSQDAMFIHRIKDCVQVLRVMNPKSVNGVWRRTLF